MTWSCNPCTATTMCPQPAWEMIGKCPKRAPTLPTVWTWMQPYNACAATMTMCPESIQAANDDDMATAHMSDDHLGREPLRSETLVFSCIWSPPSRMLLPPQYCKLT